MGPRPNRPRQRPPKYSPESIAEHTLALGWRETWRAETGENAPNKKPDGEEKKRWARFAAGIARAEFGRHYWDARKAGAPNRPPPRRNGPARD